MALDTPLSVKVGEWRRISLERKLSVEEMRQVFHELRSGRLAAAATSAKSRAAKAPVDIAGLQDEIDNL